MVKHEGVCLPWGQIPTKKAPEPEPAWGPPVTGYIVRAGADCSIRMVDEDKWRPHKTVRSTVYLVCESYCHSFFDFVADGWLMRVHRSFVASANDERAFRRP